MKNQYKNFLLTMVIGPLSIVSAQNNFISTQQSAGNFPISSSGKSASIVVGERDWPGVVRAAKNLQHDIETVIDHTPLLINTLGAEKDAIIIGTIGKNDIIDNLIREKKIDVAGIAGKWETFMIETIDHPTPQLDRALVIAGSDKRGTIFGIYEVSRQIGVSPWYWWADVQPKKAPALYVKSGRYVQGEPPVKYRGIFLNDEEPALGRWAVEKYGGFNHEMYEKVFELILRLKGNYLWPAMWWASFNSDDPINPKLADEMGVVIGTTHHEPMMRAHAEWKHINGGEWNYTTNQEKLRKFWEEGIVRMNGYESIVSIGMRGDGDMAMSEETNISLLEKIVSDQRNIITRVTGKSIEQTPQLWALYKEVQDYYDKGMRVPDDVTLLLCDDNWGNIRKLPDVKDSLRSGGYGIYYHFDYVGGPRNYKWINTNSLPRTWEQMHLAYTYGANKIWLVNVGDLKPMELPISFFLDYAWNPASIQEDDINKYTTAWACEQFGATHASEIADILSTYAKYNARRKPELLSAETYSLVHYREAERVTSDYQALYEKAFAIANDISLSQKDAYYELVLHPVEASANLYALYLTVAKNRLYARQGRAATNKLAADAWELFKKDAAISAYYNHTLANGKWNHMMDQTHIGYTIWQQPAQNYMPNVDSVTINDKPSIGVSIEGNENDWPLHAAEFVLPEFYQLDPQSHYIEIFNRGMGTINYSIAAKSPLVLSKVKGSTATEDRIEVSVDWKKIKAEKTKLPIMISAGGKSVTVYAVINNTQPKKFEGYVETNGYVSIDAEHFTRAISSSTMQWKILPDHGKTSSSVTTYPVTAPAIINDSTRLEYSVYIENTNDLKIDTYLSPSLNFNGSPGLRYAISVDDEKPQVVTLQEDKSLTAWEKSVADNIIIKSTTHKLGKAGAHIIKFWRVDPGVVLQKIVAQTRPCPVSYLGPPESKLVQTK